MGGYIIIGLVVILGLFRSSDLRNGVGTTVGATIAFTPMVVLGTVYMLIPYAIYFAIKRKRVKVFLLIWDRWFDGVCSAVGDFLKYGFAYKYDELSNVCGGELLEDLIGTEEKTPLGIKKVTVSAAIGYYEEKSLFMNGFGRGLSKALNSVFRQTMHCLGSWKKKLFLDELEEMNLLGNKKKK